MPSGKRMPDHMPVQSTALPTPPPDVSPLPAGTAFGKYRILRFVARGAMGMVYEAQHTTLRTRHALKIIHPHLARDERFLKRFRHEARLMANLDHPNITRVTDFGQEGEFCFFVMEFVAGPKGRPETLQDVFNEASRQHPLSDREIRELFIQICAALEYCHHFHANGVVHRDLKPSNILLRPPDSALPRVAITDFGLAEMAGGLETFSTMMPAPAPGPARGAAAEEVSGTPRYMSPEQWQPGAPVGPASDIFTVGVLLFQALTRRLPFPDSRALLGEKPAKIDRPSRCGRSHVWDSVVLGCLSVEPGARPSAETLLKHISRISTHRLRTLLGAALLLMTLAGVWLWPMTPKRQPTPLPAPAPVESPAIKREQLETEPVPAAPSPDLKDIALQVQVPIEYGQPFSLPRSGEMSVNGGPWEPVSLPSIIQFPHHESERPIVLTLRVAGYETARVDRVEGADGRGQAIFPLIPRPAHVTISCNVPTARILYGDRDLGPVGQTIELEAFREHRLVIRSPRHREQVLVINRPDPGLPAPPVYHVELETIPGRVRVEATRPDVFHPRKTARIFLDDRLVAEEKLPFVLTGLTQEFVRVGIAVEGYKPLDPRTVRVDAGQETVAKFDLAFFDAFLDLHIAPSNAVAMLSGMLLTTNRVRVIPEQFYTLRVEAPDHLPYAKQFALMPNETRSVEVNLTARSFVLLEVDPPNAAVFIGGQRFTGRRMEVRGNESTAMEFRAPNHQPFVTNVMVREGETKSLSIKLRPR